MIFSSILNAPITGFYLLLVRIKLFGYYQSMKKKKKIVTAFLFGKFEAEGMSNKTINKLISNYVELGNAILDRKLLKQGLLARHLIKKIEVKDN